MGADEFLTDRDGHRCRRPFNPRRGIRRKLEMTEGSVRNRTFTIRAGSVVSHTLILFLESPFATPNQLFRLRRSVPAEKLQCLGLQLVGGHEEFFELFHDLGRPQRLAVHARGANPSGPR